MKTTTLRVQPELKESAKAILRQGESLSAFVEDSLRRNVEFRRTQQEFIARGLISREAAKKSGIYFSHEDVMRGLDEILAVKIGKLGK
ncbi:MAG: YlcI/YnfO family protein [Gallionellaceae bacterium]|nr:YlcI/YnfO family protein [Gallionellaceae bacterium]